MCLTRDDLNIINEADNKMTFIVWGVQYKISTLTTSFLTVFKVADFM